MAPPAHVALAGSQGLSFFSYTSTSDPPLVLTAAAPASSSCAPIWHPSGSQCLTIGREGVQVWTRGGQRLYEIKTDALERVAAAVFHGDGVAVASGSMTRVYSSTALVTATLGGHFLGSTVTSLSTNSDDSLLASAAGSSLIIYNRSSQTQSTLHAKPKAPYSVLAFAPTRRTLLAAATSTGLLHLFDISKPSAPLRTLSLSSSPHPPSITNVAFSPVGPLLVASTSTGQLSLVDTEKQKVVISFDVGVEIGKGKMSLGPDGRSVLLVGDGVVRILDIKTRKGMREMFIEGGGELGGISFQPAPSKLRSLSNSRSSPNKPASSILTDSINRMRAAQRSSSPSKEQVKSSAASKPAEPPRMLDAIEEVFSPLRSDTGRAGNLKLAPQDLPASKEVFAESIAREARTSTIRTVNPRRAETPSDRLAQSSLASYPSPNLPSYSPEPEPLLHRRSRSSTSQSASQAFASSASQRSDSLSRRSSAASLRAVSPAMSIATSTHLNETTGAITRGLKLPELEDAGTVGRPKESRRSGSSTKSHREIVVLEDEDAATPVPKVKKVKPVKVKAVKEVKEVKEVKPVERAPSGLRDVGRRIAAPAPVLGKDLQEVVSPTETPSRAMDGQSAEGSRLLEQMMRTVMEEYAARSSRDVQNLHLELIRRTFAQKTEIASLKTLFGAEVQQLREENTRLRQENERLRSRT